MYPLCYGRIFRQSKREVDKGTGREVQYRYLSVQQSGSEVGAVHDPNFWATLESLERILRLCDLRPEVLLQNGGKQSVKYRDHGQIAEITPQQKEQHQSQEESL